MDNHTQITPSSALSLGLEGLAPTPPAQPETVEESEASDSCCSYIGSSYIGSDDDISMGDTSPVDKPTTKHDGNITFVDTPDLRFPKVDHANALDTGLTKVEDVTEIQRKKLFKEVFGYMEKQLELSLKLYETARRTIESICESLPTKSDVALVRRELDIIRDMVIHLRTHVVVPHICRTLSDYGSLYNTYTDQVKLNKYLEEELELFKRLNNRRSGEQCHLLKPHSAAMLKEGLEELMQWERIKEDQQRVEEDVRRERAQAEKY